MEHPSAAELCRFPFHLPLFLRFLIAKGRKKITQRNANYEGGMEDATLDNSP